MASRRKRVRVTDEYDRDQQAVVNIAVQTAHAQMDKERIDATRENFRDGMPSHTANPDLPGQRSSAFQGLRGQIAWRSKDSVGQELMVMSAINGADQQASEAYPDDPEMARQALKASIQPVGIFAQNSESVDGSKPDPDVGLIVHGLHTMQAVGAVAGARAVADVPPLGTADPRVGSNADGTGCEAQFLVVRAANPDLESARLAHAMHSLITNPEAWRRATSGAIDATQPWLNAADWHMRSGVIQGMMMVSLLLEKGKIIVPPTSPELLTRAGGQLDALEMMSRLGQFFGLVAEGDAIQLLTQAQATQYHDLKHEFARKANYSPNPSTGKLNVRDEFGVSFDRDAARVRSRARTDDDAFELRQDTPEADVVSMQLNHHRLAMAAILHAINEDRRWTIGTFTSSSIQEGSGAAKVSAHFGK